MALHRYGVPCHLSATSRRSSASNVQVAWLVSKCPLALLWRCLFTRLCAKANFNVSVFGCLVFCNLVVGFFQGADLLLVVVVRREDDAATVWGLPRSKCLWILGSCYVVRALAQRRRRHHFSAITVWLHGLLTRSLCSSHSKLLLLLLLVEGAVSIDLCEPAAVLGRRRALRAFCNGVLGLQAEPGLIIHALAHLRRLLCTLRIVCMSCILLLHALNLGYRLALRIVLGIVATRLITAFVMH